MLATPGPPSKRLRLITLDLLLLPQGVLGGELLLDPTAAEESAEGGGVLLAHMAKRNEVTQIIMRGEWNNIKTNAALDLAIAGCQQLDVAMRASIQEAAAGAVS